MYNKIDIFSSSFYKAGVKYLNHIFISRLLYMFFLYFAHYSLTKVKNMQMFGLGLQKK